VIPYSEDTRKRHYHRTQRGKVIEFMVQLEVKAKGSWRPVIRYDCAHDYAHRDHYNSAGEQKKEDLQLSYGEALTLGDQDIRENWRTYRDRFLKGGHPR
jgi:hypothetical protein